MVENAGESTFASALMAGMEIIAKSEDFSDQFARSLAKMAPAKMAPASARRLGPESFATRATSVEGTHPSYPDSEGILL